MKNKLKQILLMSILSVAVLQAQKKVTYSNTVDAIISIGLNHQSTDTKKTVGQIQKSSTLQNEKSATTNSAATGKILFTCNDGGNYKLYTMSPDGSNFIGLTDSSTDNNMAARWSKDGIKIVFIRNENNIWTMNSDGSNQQFICTGQSAAFSPDGKELVFANEFSIYRYNLDSKESVLIRKSNINLGVNFTPDWQPNGSYIIWNHKNLYQGVFARGVDLHDLTGVRVGFLGGPVDLTKNGDYGPYSDDPRFSTDGSKIVFSQSSNQSSTDAQICTINTDGTNLTYEVQTSNGALLYPILSPDNKFFTCNHNNAIYVIERANLSNTKQLSITGAKLIPCDWNNSGTTAGINLHNEASLKVYVLGQQAIVDLSKVSGETVIKVYDAKGVLSKELKSNGSELVNLNLQNKGFYLVRIQNDAKIFTQKLMMY